MIAIAAAALAARAQQAPQAEPAYKLRYALAAINDATFLGGLQVPIPKVENRILLEPSFTLHIEPRFSVSSSLVGICDTHGETHSQVRVKEAYAGISAGDFDFMAGRRIVRWGTGYAFTAAGVLDPPRMATDPGDRLNLNAGRDMVKADWVHGRHAFSLAWATAALAGRQSNLRDTTAFRYNVLVRGFDTALIAGDDRGGNAFGGLTFTRVLGQAWELHGEAAWREQAALLLGAKYTTTSGVTFLGEYFTPPDTAFYREASLPPGRPHAAFLRVSKSRLRELPGWREWDLAGSAVANLNDHSWTAVFDAERRFGNRFSSYVHLEAPSGAGRSQFGATPYTTATSFGFRFQL